MSEDSTLIARIDERQKHTDQTTERLEASVAQLSKKVDALSVKIDALINKGLGASAVLMFIGGAIVYVIDKLVFK